MPAPRPNQLYVVISLTLVLFLLGLVGWWALQANRLTAELQENLDIVVELEADITPTTTRTLTATLKAAPFHRPGTEPTLITRAQALADMGETLENDLAQLGLNNPLLDIITFNVPLDYLQSDSLAAMATFVGEQPGVAGVYYQENFVERITDNARRATYLLLGLAALFTLVAGLLIHNTVRLSLYANRMIIKTQELVGANWSFISRPYLWRAVGQGLVAGLVAAGGVFGLQYWLQGVFPELQLMAAPSELAIFYGALVGLGIIINFLSHYVVVRHYLRLRLDDLY